MDVGGGPRQPILIRPLIVTASLLVVGYPRPGPISSTPGSPIGLAGQNFLRWGII